MIILFGFVTEKTTFTSHIVISSVVNITVLISVALKVICHWGKFIEEEESEK